MPQTSRTTAGRVQWRALLVGALLLAACRSVTDPLPPVTLEVETALQRWRLTAPPAYEVTITRRCFCGLEYSRPVRMTVQGGVVVSRHYADDGRPYLSTFVPPSVDDLFTMIARANEAREFVRAAYDPEYGFPRDVYLEGRADVADDEVTYILSPLRRL